MKTRTRDVRQSFCALDWIVPVPEHFLHVSLGDADSALGPFRDAELGRGVVDEIFLCEVPFAGSTFLQPWRVLDSVKLRSPRPL